MVAHHRTGVPALPGEPGHVGWRPLNWATEPVNGEVDIRQAVGWLATGLEGRDFRSDRLARDLGSGAEVVLGRLVDPAVGNLLRCSPPSQVSSAPGTSVTTPSDLSSYQRT